MAQNLPDVVVNEQARDDAPPSYEDTQTSEAESIIAEIISKERRLSDNVVDVPPSYEDTQRSEAESLIAEMKSKADADRKEMKERLNEAKQVKEKDG